MIESKVLSHLFGSQVRPLKMGAADCANYAELAKIGINFAPAQVAAQYRSLCMGAADDVQGLTMAPASIPTPVQYLQSWLPGFVQSITAAQVIDEIIGVTTAGKWEDEEVVQKVMEHTGSAQLYGDSTRTPLASWSVAFERRTVVRFEEGMEVGLLEEARTGLNQVNTAAEKRASTALALDITRNQIGFLGYNGGTNRTYGLLNDPSLPAYITAAATGVGSTTTWSTKTFLNITGDLRGMIARLRAAGAGRVNPETSPTTLGLAVGVYDYLSVTSDQGVSVRDWLAKNYPRMRVLSAPELDLANGGANVAYLFVDRVEDGSTDGGAPIAQIVPAKFKALGVARNIKSYIEDYSMATAGVMVKRPYAVQRLTGI
jgi:hypothetical protein